jgi:hypothetical protein
MAFPVPFTILTVLITFLLVVANFMKNKTRFFITLMTSTDIILKLNWIVLIIEHGVSLHESSSLWIPLGILLYCMTANFFINFFIWRKLFNKYCIEDDSEFVKYTVRFPKTYKFLLYLSFVFSFHVFRLTYSRILGMKQFSALIKNY